MIRTEYITSDIVLAASLKLSNTPMDRINIKDGRRGEFIFRNVDDELIDKIMMGKMLAEPYAFHNEIKHLTTVVAQMKGRK